MPMSIMVKQDNVSAIGNPLLSIVFLNMDHRYTVFLTREEAHELHRQLDRIVYPHTSTAGE